MGKVQESTDVTTERLDAVKALVPGVDLSEEALLHQSDNVANGEREKFLLSFPHRLPTRRINLDFVHFHVQVRLESCYPAR